MDTARKAMSEAVTFALEIDIVLDVRTGGLAIEVPVKYAGDLHAIGYSSADLTITIPFQVIESKLITSGGTNYILDPTTNAWERLPGDSPFFAGPSVFLGSDASETTDLELIRKETIDGAEAHVVSATRLGVEIGGATGDLDVLYWIGVEDGLLRKVEANGLVEFGEEGVPGLDFSIANANATLTARFFDYGKPVEITTPELALPRFEHKAFLLDDGRIFVTDGFTSATHNDQTMAFPLAIPQTYDFETGLWQLVGSTTELQELLQLDWITYHSSAKLSDGRILRLGFRVDNMWTESIIETDVFVPAVDSWTTLPNPPSHRAGPDLILLDDGRLLAVGGFEVGLADGPVGTEFLGKTDIFDPKAGEWQQAAPMAQPLFRQAAARLSDGRVLVVGGSMSDGTESASAEIYDPDADIWTTVEGMSVERGQPRSVLLSDGRVLVTGDPRSDLSATTGKVEIYDPDDGMWTPVGDLPHPSIAHTLTLLPDGRVLAAGGRHPVLIDSSIYSTTRIFDPAANSWSPGPELAEPRAYHTATLMPDGRVLLIGGIGQEDEQYILISSEFVSP